MLKSLRFLRFACIFIPITFLQASSHHRTKFQPAPEHEPAAISEQFEKLAQAEKDREDALTAELKRQEHLTELAKEFAIQSEELISWCQSTEAYLKRAEDVGTVVSAQIQLDLLKSHETEYDASSAKVEQLRGLEKQLSDGNYHEKDSVAQKLSEVVAMWTALKALADTKMGVLKEAEAKEMGKEALRVEFAKQAKEFERWTRALVDTVEQYAFGSNLEEVRGYKSSKEANDAELMKDSEAKKSAIMDVWSKMQEAGVSDNVHTMLGEKDISGFVQMLEAALAKRTQAYENELARQEDMENTRKKFAEAAQELVSSVEKATAALEAITGEPEDRAVEIKKVHESSSEELKAKLITCEEIDNQAKELKIIDNKHTPFTMVTLKAKLQKLESFVSNLLASTEQEKVMKERKLERQAEWAKKEQIESERNLYQTKAQTLNQWLDNASEVLGQVPRVSTSKEVQDLKQQLDDLLAALPAQSAIFSELGELSTHLAEKEVTDIKHERVVDNWNQCQNAIEARKQWLEKETVTQEQNQALRVSFAEKANSFNELFSFLSLFINYTGGLTRTRLFNFLEN